MAAQNPQGAERARLITASLPADWDTWSIQTYDQAVVEEEWHLEMDALMDVRGGEAAARWRSAKEQGEAFHAYQAAALAYRLAQDLPRLKTELISALRLAQGALTRTPLTPELMHHGWSPRFVRFMAELLADYQNQVDNDTFQVDWDVDYGIGRTMLEEISPMWLDHDEIKEAVQHRTSPGVSGSASGRQLIRIRRNGTAGFNDFDARSPALGASVTTPPDRIVIRRRLSRVLAAAFRPDAFPFDLALNPPDRVGRGQYFDVP